VALRLPHQADALKQLDTRLDEPEPKPQRRRGTETPSATEGEFEIDRTEETPPTSTNHMS